MSNKTISVIVPCYNVETYVECCLESLLNQTYKELEIIVIDDGSTDSTAVYIRNFLLDKRVKFFSQPHKGVSAARNKGLVCASGDFIAFMDGDDWLVSDMYERMLDILLSDHSDMAVCNYNLQYEEKVVYQYSNMIRATVDIDDPYLYFCQYCSCAKPNNYVWSRLYRRKSIEQAGLRFCNYSQGEDTLFNFMLLPYIRRVSFLPEALYNYRQHSQSLVHSITNADSIAIQYADTFDTLVEHYRKNKFDDFLRVLPVHAATRIRSVFFYSRLRGLCDDEIVRNIIKGFRGRKIADYLTGKI